MARNTDYSQTENPKQEPTKPIIVYGTVAISQIRLSEFNKLGGSRSRTEDGTLIHQLFAGELPDSADIGTTTRHSALRVLESMSWALEVCQ